MTTALDASVMVAALATWHERHEAARTAVSALLADGAVTIPGHAIVEAFSVFTRVPPGYRISPTAARDLLRCAFEGRATLAADDPQAPWEVLDAAVRCGVAGGAVCDFRILRAAAAAGATRLLTLNAPDFRRFGLPGVEIVEP